MSNAQKEIEQSIRDAFEVPDYDLAATILMQQYGGEIFVFLADRLRSESEAEEVFSEFAEDVWNGLPGFQWRASIRGWAYMVARNAANRYTKAPHRKPTRNLPLLQNSRLYMEVDRLRSETKRYMRTEIKSKIRKLREQLPDDDQTLLVLRIDRQLSWRELATIVSGQCDNMDEIDRLSARLRQRFHMVKEHLRKMAQAEGLLRSNEE